MEYENYFIFIILCLLTIGCHIGAVFMISNKFIRTGIKKNFLNVANKTKRTKNDRLYSSAKKNSHLYYFV